MDRHPCVIGAAEDQLESEVDSRIDTKRHENTLLRQKLSLLALSSLVRRPAQQTDIGSLQIFSIFSPFLRTKRLGILHYYKYMPLLNPTDRGLRNRTKNAEANMRLTLRTLLCYLDDVLKPEDAEEIAKKIEESEFASGLVHRIRGSMRKLRLGAPRLDGKGVGLDANTVAEYLDSTLASDRVPDLEKICLESDLHLAEVAACHQILTLVLGEPADISPELRDRMYQIPDEAVRPPQVPASTSVSSTATAEPPRPPLEPQSLTTATAGAEATDAGAETVHDAPPTHEVPDYLKAGEKKPAIPLVATALLLFLVLSIAVFAIGPKNVARWFGGPESDGEPVAEADGEPSVSEKTDESAAAGDSVSSDPRDSKTVPVSDEPKTQDDAEASPTKENVNSAESTTNPETPSDMVDNAHAPDGHPLPETTVEPEVDKIAAPDAAAGKPDTPAIDEPAEDTEPAAVDVGRLVSTNQMLGRLDPESGAWMRPSVADKSGAILKSGDRLLALPTYRPQIAFISGLQVTVVGPAACTLIGPDETGVPGLALDYGQAIALTVAKPNAQLNVDLAGTRGTITFVQADSEVAFEVTRYLSPGDDPETTEAQVIVQIFARGSQIQWQPAEGGPESLSDNKIVVLSEGRTYRGTLNALPTWLEPSEGTNIDKIASEALEKLVPGGRSLMLSLEELLGHNRLEVRLLAGRCLSYLDNFDAFVAMLSDPNSKSFWIKQIEAAREALARGPESAKAVRIAFERMRGEEAGELYRLLWGYSPGQLATGADAQLVEYLSHEDMDFRVLVFENLRRITGKIGSYRPEEREPSRTSKISYWRDKLDNGEIVYRTPPRPPTLIPID